ncbi:MAG: acetylglutamate kinase [Planctomycetota bacterium]|nr:acetylglutamate kinase [Planctomycetota bacterium]MDP6990131.1 acetylglutamate kinase [Planctomycetota bacterium]
MIDLFLASEYARLHRGQVMVVKVGGACLASAARRRSLARQLAAVDAFGARLVVVHGGGPQTGELQELLGERPRSVDGRRVTTPTALRALGMATAGAISTEWTAAMCEAGANAVGVCAASAGIVVASRRAPMETSEGAVDLGLVGDVQTVDAAPLAAMLDAGLVPVVCPPVSDGRGGLLNLNADLLAASLAAALSAAKLILATEASGVLSDHTDPRSVLSTLTLAELEDLGRGGALRDGMSVKATAVRHALDGGVARVHVVSGTTAEGVLGELYTTHGTGTLVTLERETAPEPEPAVTP